MFRIVIEEIKTVESVGRSYEKVSDAGNERGNGAVYDYVTFPSTKDVTTKILEQNVEQVDVKAVVKAVLGL